MEDALTAFETHPEIFMGVLSTNVDPEVGKAFTDILFDSLRYLGKNRTRIGRDADIKRDFCGGDVYARKTEACVNGAIRREMGADGRCSIEEKNKYDRIMSKASASTFPISSARVYMSGAFAVCLFASFFISVLEVRHFQRDRRSRVSLRYVVDILDKRGLIAVALLLALAAMLAFAAARVDAYQLKFLRTGTPAACASASSDASAQQYVRVDADLKGVLKKSIDFSDQLRVLASSLWIHLMMFISIHRAMGRQWPWVWQFNRAKRKRRRRRKGNSAASSGGIELGDFSTAGKETATGGSPRRAKRSTGFLTQQKRLGCQGVQVV